MTVMLLKNTLELVLAGSIVDFNMAATTVDGKRLFRLGDVPRDRMPQLKGFPRRGSVAEELPKDSNGKVMVADEFLNYLTDVLCEVVTPDVVNARDLQGSQSELVASKVAKHALKMLDKPNHKKLHATYIVSRGGILIDGHHGWAAVRCFETMTNTNVTLNVLRINCDINTLLDRARGFTAAIGIENKEGV
jgi:hypothetical protein